MSRLDTDKCSNPQGRGQNVVELDHIVVSCARLSEGVAYVEDLLGVQMPAGGQHPKMGTHNRVMSLGRTYLEVIAIDPEGVAPDHPRWFDLDHFQGPPRLTNWVARTDDLANALLRAPSGIGSPSTQTRGDLEWCVAISPTGTLPFDGMFPGLIEWRGPAHPCDRLPDQGIALRSFTVQHRSDLALSKALTDLGMTPGTHQIVNGPPAMIARFDTPKGVVQML